MKKAYWVIISLPLLLAWVISYFYQVVLSFQLGGFFGDYELASGSLNLYSFVDGPLRGFSERDFFFEMRPASHSIGETIVGGAPKFQLGAPPVTDYEIYLGLPMWLIFGFFLTLFIVYLACSPTKHLTRSPSESSDYPDSNPDDNERV